MSYAIPDIILWAKISQPLARFGEAKKRAENSDSVDEDLDMKLYITRRDVEYAYAQDPTSDNTYQQANYLLTLCGIYLFQAQQVTGGGGSITPITPNSVPNPYEFEVDSSSFIPTNGIVKVITNFIGFNIIFVRNHITQSTVNDGGTYYSWDKVSGTFTLLNGTAQLGELFQIYPLV